MSKKNVALESLSELITQTIFFHDGRELKPEETEKLIETFWIIKRLESKIRRKERAEDPKKKMTEDIGEAGKILERTIYEIADKIPQAECENLIRVGWIMRDVKAEIEKSSF